MITPKYSMIVPALIIPNNYYHNMYIHKGIPYIEYRHYSSSDRYIVEYRPSTSDGFDNVQQPTLQKLPQKSLDTLLSPCLF